MHHKQLMMQSNCMAESEIEEGYIVKTVTMLNRPLQANGTGRRSGRARHGTSPRRPGDQTGLTLHARFASD